MGQYQFRFLSNWNCSSVLVSSKLYFSFLSTNSSIISVSWEVDGVIQGSELTENLNEGANQIIRSTLISGTTFSDTVSSLLWFKKIRKLNIEDFDCDCLRLRNPERGVLESNQICRKAIEYSMCFSLVVNRERMAELTVVEKRYCAYCGTPSVRIENAKVCISPKERLSSRQLQRLRRALEVEIEAKVKVTLPLAATEEE